MKWLGPKTICYILCVAASGALGWCIAVHGPVQPTSGVPSQPPRNDQARGSDTAFPDTAPHSSAMIGSYLYGFDHETNEASNAHPARLLLNDPRACQGYTLLAPVTSTKTCLVDMQGWIVHVWESDCTPALSAHLLDNGHLLRTGTLLPWNSPGFGPGYGGRIQEFTWNGQLVWDFKLSNDKYRPHHDAIKLPNGNVLMIVLDEKTAQEAAALGRKPALLKQGSWQPDALLEIRPTGPTTGAVVWEWHVADHLVQDVDASRANYGRVADHPELIDVNYDEGRDTSLIANPQHSKALQSIGYVGSSDPTHRAKQDPEWTHINSVAYNAKLNEVLLSVRAFSEIWIIDHGTTTREAAGHTGGRRGQGGDLLYRWGNPAVYDAGNRVDRRLFAQHSAMWIPPGLPGAGHVLVFNNGMGRTGGSYSSVDEIALPVKSDGTYDMRPTKAYGPDRPVWSYTASRKSAFFDTLLSSAQRLANGDTLICDGMTGTVFEVTPKKEVVWKYVCSGASPLFRAYRYTGRLK
jgi:hypothetical protein